MTHPIACLVAQQPIATPSRMNRSCQRHTTRFDSSERGIVSLVRHPSAELKDLLSAAAAHAVGGRKSLAQLAAAAPHGPASAPSTEGRERHARLAQEPLRADWRPTARACLSGVRPGRAARARKGRCSKSRMPRGLPIGRAGKPQRASGLGRCRRDSAEVPRHRHRAGPRRSRCSSLPIAFSNLVGSQTSS
jgi:hypothetical protein